MKILITGAGGFLGKNICKFILEEKIGEIHGLGRNHYPELDELNITQHKVNITNPIEVNHLFEIYQFDAIIHTAAKAGVWGDFENYYQINYLGTCNLLNAAMNSKVKYFVHTSTPSVVFGSKSIINGDERLQYPAKFLTHYAHTKFLAEKEVLSIPSNKFQTISLRPHLIYGPNDPHILPRLVAKNKEGRLRIIGNGKNKVDVTHVETAARAHVKALKAMTRNSSLSNEAYFIGDKEPVELWGFINKMLEEVGEKGVKKRIGQRLCYIIGFFCEIVYKFLPMNIEPPMTRFICLQLSTDHYFSHEKANRDFGF